MQMWLMYVHKLQSASDLQHRFKCYILYWNVKNYCNLELDKLLFGKCYTLIFAFLADTKSIKDKRTFSSSDKVAMEQHSQESGVRLQHILATVAAKSISFRLSCKQFLPTQKEKETLSSILVMKIEFEGRYLLTTFNSIDRALKMKWCTKYCCKTNTGTATRTYIG